MSETLYFRPCHDISGDRATARRELDALAWALFQRLTHEAEPPAPEIPLDRSADRG